MVRRVKRRAVTVPAVTTMAALLTMSAPLWLPVAMLVDLVRSRLRFPIARLLVFAVCWTWIELAGVLGAFRLTLLRRSHDEAAHYALMSWWAATLMRALTVTVGIRPELHGADAVRDGNAIVMARHASLGDSLLSAWAVASESGLRPRYVLKRELLFDPCLDIVGLRVPNHFLDRAATDGSTELDSIRALGAGVGPNVVGVIFSEGTRSNDDKRARALDKIAEREPERARRLGALRRLLPPRAAGSMAFVEGAPDADVVLAWHTGFDGFDSFRGMVDMVGNPLVPARFVARRIPRSEVPDGDAFAAWLDEQWLRMDAEVDSAIATGVVPAA